MLHTADAELGQNEISIMRICSAAKGACIQLSPKRGNVRKTLRWTPGAKREAKTPSMPSKGLGSLGCGVSRVVSVQPGLPSTGAGPSVPFV